MKTTAIGVMAANVLLTHKSTSSLAVYELFSALIDSVFANLIVRARFWYALTGSMVSLGIYVTGIAQLQSLPFEARISAIMAMIIVVTCTRYANFSLERHECSAYIVALREQIRSGLLSIANQELSRISDLDALTGLANRRALDRRFEAIWLAAQASRQSVAVLKRQVFRRDLRERVQESP